MPGAIAGDIIGSPYERSPVKTTDFPLFGPGSRFTDDTVLTVAVAEFLLSGGDLVELFVDYFHRYPDAGFGGMFFEWARSNDRRPYNSWGNGSAMRVSPVGFAFDTLDEALEAAAETAAVTHDHPEGVKGAQAIAAAVFLARTGASKADIRAFVEDRFQYNLRATCDMIRRGYQFNVSCQGSVPPAIIAFLDSESYEDAVRKAVSLGGDSDTLACMAGGIAQAYYGGVPDHIGVPARQYLDTSLEEVVSSFENAYGCGPNR